MSLAAICLMAVVFGQTTPNISEPAGSQLQLGPLQAPHASDVPLPSDVGPSAPKLPVEPTPAALQAPASTPYRSIYDGQPEAAADSAPTLSLPGTDTSASAPAMLPSATSAESLLQEALAVPERDGVRGTPVALKSLLGQTASGTRRLEAVAAYWRLAHAICAYHYALDEQRRLMSLPAESGRDDQPTLAAAQATARAERAEAQLAAMGAQQALAEIASSVPGVQWPLPADPPFVGAYRTYFKELNERGAVANELRHIDETLPVIHELVEAQAEAVVAAGTARSQIQRAYEQGQASLGQLLDAHERLRRHRRAFLMAVEKYNGQIARYALSVTLPAATGERVVGMLIDTGRGHKSVLASKKDGGQIQRVSGEEPVNEQGSPVFRTPRLNSP